MSSNFDLNGSVCLPLKLAISIVVSIVVVFSALSLAYNTAIRKARLAVRNQAKQEKSTKQQLELSPKSEKADGALGDEVTVSEEEQKTAKIFGMLDAPYKMVLCVNTSLKMEKGKIAAQCGHATLACYRKSLKMCPDAVAWWERLGQAKIALKINDESEMDIIQAKARALGLATYIVEDAGRTQIAAGSRTVLGIGPAPVKVIDSITSHLKLL